MVCASNVVQISNIGVIANLHFNLSSDYAYNYNNGVLVFSYAPNVVSSSAAASSSSGSSTGSSSATPPPSIPLDPSQPTTSLQIRLADGTRLTAKFNHTHTVNDVRQFIDLYP